MTTQNTTVAVILFKSKTLANGEHPLMIRVCKNRVRKHVSIGLSCHINDWDFKNNLPKKNHPHKEKYESIIAKAIRQYKDKVIDFKDEDKDFTPDILIEAASNPIKKITLFKYFELKVENLIATQQIGNSRVYYDTYRQLKQFTKDKDITFSQVDYAFLIKFENHLKARGITDNAISVRFRTLRAAFNSAIAEKCAKKESYPFDKFKISERFSTKTQKRAITREDLKKIEEIVLDEESTAYEAQQYFIFSFYGQGINFGDIAKLKWSNVINGRVFYKRAKTGNEQNFKLQPPALKIIEHWRPATKANRDTYIFPILNDLVHVSPTQQYNRIHKVLTRVNRDLKEIGKQVGIDIPITSYVARHTFATALKRTGVSTTIISESMGHKTEAITQTYLKSFEDSIIDEAMENLL